MADLAQQAAQTYAPPAAGIAGTAALANAVAAAPNIPPPAPAPFVPPADPTVASGVPAVGQPIAGAPAQDSTIVVTPAPTPPPKVTVVPKPPGPPSALPAGTGGVTPPSPELQGLMANATAPADPNGDAVDQALAADAVSGRASANAPKPGDMAASGAAATAAGQAQSAALRDTGDAEAQAAAAETKAREQQARELETKAAEQRQIRDQAAAHVQQLREKAAKEPYHTLFEGAPGSMALAGIGILLGSASYSANHVNQASALIDRAIKQNFDVQQAKHAQLWKDVETAMEEGRQLRADQLDDMANFRARQAATLDAVIAKGKELSGRAKNREMAAALDAKNAQMAFERDKAYDEVARLKAAQLETERHNKADEGIGRGRLGIERQRLTVDKQNAEELKVGKAVDQQLNRDVVTTGLLKARASLEDAKAGIASGNPVAIQGAIDSYIRAKTGLGARQGSIKMFTDRLGGALEQLNAHIEQWKSGGIPPAMIKRFNDAVNAEYDEGTRALTRAQKLHEKALLASPEYARHADLVKAHIADRFSALAGGEAPTTPPPGAIMGKLNGKRGYVLNGQFTALE